MTIVQRKTAMQNPKLEIINIFLCDNNLLIKEKTNPPAAFPIKAKAPMLPMAALLHSIPNSVAQLYPNSWTTV